MSASISCRESSADCASKGTLASGIGVDAGVGFAGEPEACWLGAVPALETKARIITRTSRIIGCIKRDGQKAPQRKAHVRRWRSFAGKIKSCSQSLPRLLCSFFNQFNDKFLGLWSMHHRFKVLKFIE